MAAGRTLKELRKETDRFRGEARASMTPEDAGLADDTGRPFTPSLSKTPAPPAKNPAALLPAG